MNTAITNTKIGNFLAVDQGNYLEYRGIKYANSERWEYPVQVTAYGDYDATEFGANCFQRRAFEDDATCSAFYHKEFRQGMTFDYSEDCQYLNIYAPKTKKSCPVLVYIHGGSFTGGSSNEGHIDGRAYAQHGIIFVSINYRLGPYGFCAHSSMLKDGVCGNYGLADQKTAMLWLKKNIAEFGGNPNRIIVLGQSAGAMSVDILLSDPALKGLFKGAVMMSGAGLQRFVAKPLSVDKMDKFWDAICKEARVNSMEELKDVNEVNLYYAWDNVVKSNPVNMLCTLPMHDGRIVTADFVPAKIPAMPIMLGVTVTDMMAIGLEGLTKQYANKAAKNGADVFVYSFDRLLPGDESGAWHSCDLLYAFATLKNNWRPFEQCDYRISAAMVEAISNFVLYSDPNCSLLPTWKKGSKEVMHLGESFYSAPLDKKVFLNSTFGKGGAKF